MIHAAYLHIPFCKQICHYCDFNKVFLKNQPVEDYLTALETEIELTFAENPPQILKSIFVGGGTPTALSEAQLQTFCDMIKRKLPYDEKTEFTVEANPGDLSREKFAILKEAGVNRISLGVQTFNNELLKKIGRTHQAKDVFASIELAKQFGFNNISIDLIYGLPEQTIEDFKQTLKTAFSLELAHCSGYSLIIEPKTVFYNLMNRGKLALVGEDVEAEMYGILLDEMEKHGYKQYEISNFAFPGFESRHNLTYWNNDYYYGFGAGAHSYVNGFRRANFSPLKKYMEPLRENKLPLLENHLVTKGEAIEEEMFLGLRKTAGVSLSKFREKFTESPVAIFGNQLQELMERGLIDITNDSIRLTKKGKFLGNEVFQTFLGVI